MKIAILFRSELRRLFYSYTLLFLIPLFFLVNGVQFNLLVNTYALQSKKVKVVQSSEKFMLNLTDSVFRPFLGNMSLLMMIFLSFLTMGSVASQRASGELALTYTYPVSNFAILLARFLALYSVCLLLLLFSYFYPYMLGQFFSLPPKIVATAYLGMALLGAFYISVGLFTSTLSRSSVIAGLGSFFTLFIFWSFSFPATLLRGFAKDFFEHLCPMTHLDFFLQGIIQSKDVTFFLSASSLFFILSLFALDRERWQRDG